MAKTDYKVLRARFIKNRPNRKHLRDGADACDQGKKTAALLTKQFEGHRRKLDRLHKTLDGIFDKMYPILDRMVYLKKQYDLAVGRKDDEEAKSLMKDLHKQAKIFNATVTKYEKLFAQVKDLRDLAKYAKAVLTRI